MRIKLLSAVAPIALAVSMLPADPALASSHREAPFVGGMGRVDSTDFYMFVSYEGCPSACRSGFVTFMANYQPFQNIGGPNFYPLDDTANYNILINNDGKAVENLTFQFRFTNTLQNLTLPAGGVNVPVALSNLGQFGRNGDPKDTANLNRIETYTVNLIRGPRREGFPEAVTNATTGSAIFSKPADNYGTRSAPDYAAYAAAHVTPINIPGCTTSDPATQGRVFVGQRRDPFNINLGQTFDLIDYATVTIPPNPLETGLVSQNSSTVLSPPAGENNKNAGQNTNRNNAITSIELEIPTVCLVNPATKDPVIGAWTNAELPRSAILTTLPDAAKTEIANVKGEFVQVSRDAMALVNELVIGLPDKDRFNSAEPVNDGAAGGFGIYVTHPTFPEALQALFGAKGAVADFGIVAPTTAGRPDLVAAFLTGVKGLNQPMGTVVPAEMMRLNTAIMPVAAAQQDPLGVIDGDAAGYPNGRRPGDDATDITLRVADGFLINPLGLFGQKTDAPSGPVLLTQGARSSALAFDQTFPYLQAPFPENLAGEGN